LPLLQQSTGDGDRIRYVITREQLDDAAMRNAAAGLATGAYILFIKPAGLLARFALFYIAEALQGGSFDLIYTDEDEFDADGRRTRPVFKPDWSPELLLSCMYIGDLLAVRRDCFFEAGGLRSQYAGAHLHDLALRLADRPVCVRHIARVLYHGRSTAGTAPEPGAASRHDAATISAIEDAVRRREGADAHCVPNPVGSGFVVTRTQREEMAVVICSRSPQLLGCCLEALRRTASQAVSQIIVVAHEDTGPNPELHSVIRQAGATAVSFGGTFNFAAMNNLGVSLATKPHLLFLNDDVTATSPGWAEMLGEQLVRERVGVAGAVMRYPSGAIQHAGIVAGIGDGVGHAGRHMVSSDLWPWLFQMRNVSAVTGACLAIRSELFQRLGGFDAAFPNNYNDADLCFRVRAGGYDVVCVPVPGLIHYECQSRRGIVRFEERYRLYGRWMEILSRPDPYYSVSLSATERIALNPGDDCWYRPMLIPEGRQRSRREKTNSD
jgi:GT2 family glycosyltransferase